MRRVPVHNLRRNERTWSPPAIAVADSETRVLERGDREVLGLRLWAGAVIDRHGPKARPHDWAWSDGTTPESIAAWLDRASVGRPTLWAYFHNLSFDLVTTRLPLLLEARGWHVTDFAVTGRAPWLRLAKGTKHLALTDSWSWLPAQLAEIGAATGRAKVALPGEDDDRAAWLRRCRSDVSILAHALCELMDWWDECELGNWTITGAATGWNAARHKLSAEPMTIDPDPAGIACDRAAYYGGRRSVWRVGDMRAGPYLELDFVAAYPTVAAHELLPRKRTLAFDSLPLDHEALTGWMFSAIAQCVIDTPIPRYPVRVGGSVWYPVGRFATTLAGADLRAALAAGHLVSVGAGYVHAMGNVLSEWARWVLAVQQARSGAVPDVARIAAKHWGRAVIGKFGSHTFTRTELGPAPTAVWGYEPGYDVASGRSGGMVDLGGHRWWVVADVEADNAYPALPAFVEAHVRQALNVAIEAIGPGALVQADTDGLIVAGRALATRGAGGSLVAPDGLTGAARHQWAVDAISALTGPLRLRIKRSHAHITVLGPQHVKLGAQRRFSGLPASAEETEPDTYAFRAWPKLAWQMGHGDRRGYVRPLITQRIEGPYPTGWLLRDGRVIPPAATIGADGATRLLSWAATPGKPARAVLADAQHPYLDGLL